MSTRFRRNPAVEAAPSSEETILFHPGANRFCLLNRSAAVLWARLEEPCTVEQLTTTMCDAYGIDAQRAAGDVAAAVQSLQELELISAD